jgi:hypothetical protein
MRTELAVMEVSHSSLHVVMTGKLHDPCSISCHISEYHITTLSEVILQILPAPGGREASNHTLVAFGSPSNERSTSTSAAPSTSPWGTASSTVRRPWKLYADLIAIKIVSVSSIHGIFGISYVFKLHKGKRRVAVGMKIDISNFTKLVEYVFQIS